MSRITPEEATLHGLTWSGTVTSRATPLMAGDVSLFNGSVTSRATPLRSGDGATPAATAPLKGSDLVVVCLFCQLRMERGSPALPAPMTRLCTPCFEMECKMRGVVGLPLARVVAGGPKWESGPSAVAQARGLAPLLAVDDPNGDDVA